MITEKRVVTITTCKMVVLAYIYHGEGSTRGLESSTSGMFIVPTTLFTQVGTWKVGSE
jgi:hypothetical protein